MGVLIVKNVKDKVTLIKTKDMSTDEEKLKHEGAKELEERFLSIMQLLSAKYPNDYSNLNPNKMVCILNRLSMLYQRENMVYTNVDLKNNPLWKLPDDQLAEHLLVWVNGKNK